MHRFAPVIALLGMSLPPFVVGLFGRTRDWSASYGRNPFFTLKRGEDELDARERWISTNRAVASMSLAVGWLFVGAAIVSLVRLA